MRWPAARKRSTTPATSGAFGADHGDGDAFALDQRQQAVDVGRGDVDVAALGFGRGAGIAGRDQHFVDARRLRQLPGQRVLATAGTDDEDFHAAPADGASWDRDFT